MGKCTLVLGATERTDRYANVAIRKLRRYGHDVVAVGLRPGQVEDVTIMTEIPKDFPIDTVTLYMNPFNQIPWQPKILDLQPKRIIFNPGTEDLGFEAMAEAKGIEPVVGCTLVMLSAGTF
jgi:predicted CoA-binding protein